MRSSTFLIWVVGLVAIMAAGLVFAEDRVVETIDRSFQVTTRPELTLHNSDGIIHLVAGPDGTVTFHVTKEVSAAVNDVDAKKAADRVSIDLQQTGNRILGEARWPKSPLSFNFGFFRHPKVTVRIEVTAPPASDITADVSDGALDAGGFHGALRLTTADGHLIATDCSGNITLHASDGTIQAERLSGNLDFSISDGKLAADQCSGKLKFHASDGPAELKSFNGELESTAADGKLRVDGVLDALNVKSVDGDIDIRLADGSVLKKDSYIKATDGDVVLRLPQDLQTSVDLSSSDGRIRTELSIAVEGSLSSRHLTGKMNGGGPMLEIHTTDGNIDLVR